MVSFFVILYVYQVNITLNYLANNFKKHNIFFFKIKRDANTIAGG